MPTFDVISATTAVTDGVTPAVRYDGSVYAVPIPYDHTQVVNLVADRLDGAEVVDIYTWGGFAWTPVADQDGTPIQLTATKKADAFVAGLEYGVRKSATTAACSVRWAPAPKQF